MVIFSRCNCFTFLAPMSQILLMCGTMCQDSSRNKWLFKRLVVTLRCNNLSCTCNGMFSFRADRWFISLSGFFFNRCKIHIKLPLNRLTTEGRVENVNSVVTCLISQIPTLFEKGSKRIFYVSCRVYVCQASVSSPTRKKSWTLEIINTFRSRDQFSCCPRSLRWLTLLITPNITPPVN